MAQKKVYISASNQTGNNYATGNTNEAVQCGRVAQETSAALERCGVLTKVGHMKTMAEKCAEADAWGADLYICEHSNAASNGTQTNVAGSRLFAHTKGADGWKACEAISKYLFPLTPGTSENIKEHKGLYEINTPAAPTAYVEMEFHDNPNVSGWIIEHTHELGEAIAHGACDSLGVEWVPEKKETKAPTYEKEIFGQMLLDFLREHREEVYEALGDPMYKTIGDAPEWMQDYLKVFEENGVIDGGTAEKDGLINKRKSEITAAIMAQRICDSSKPSGHWEFVYDE